MTKSELKGKVINCTRIAKGHAIEDIPALREHFQKQVESIPDASMKETETAFEFNNGQFFLKPVINRVINGTLDFGKTWIVFRHSKGLLRMSYTDITIISEGIETKSATYNIIWSDSNE